MKLSGSEVLLLSIIASANVTGSWSFVSSASHAASPRSRTRRMGPERFNPRQHDDYDSKAAAAAAAAPLGPRLSSSSSPFDGLGDDNGEDVDVVQREAEQLEEMIRGSRGIVVEAIEREWREEMLRVLGEEGERLCSEAYEGYLDQGRGAIFVNVDMGLSGNSKGHDSAPCHSVFRTLEEVVMERSSRVKPADQMQIIQRCQEYDPESGFVVVFGHKGMLGVQVVRPSVAPGKVYRDRRRDA